LLIYRFAGRQARNDESAILGGRRKKRDACDGELPLGSNDIHAPSLAIEEHDAVGEGEERIIFRPSHIPTRMKHGATLPNDNTAGAHCLATEYLDAQSLAVRLAAVANRTLTFLMSHDFSKFQEPNSKNQTRPNWNLVLGNWFLVVSDF